MDDDIFAPGFGAPAAPPSPPSRPYDLRAWRIARGWSQFEAAKRTGMSLSTWIRWETRGVPEIRKARLKELLR